MNNGEHYQLRGVLVLGRKVNLDRLPEKKRAIATRFVELRRFDHPPSNDEINEAIANYKVPKADLTAGTVVMKKVYVMDLQARKTNPKAKYNWAKVGRTRTVEHPYN